jgi:hypothetical protein
MERVLMIPHSHREALEKLARLDDDAFAAIVRIVGTPVNTFRRGELVTEIAEAVAGFTKNNAHLLLASILSAQTIRQRQAWSPIEAAEAIADVNGLDVGDLRPQLVRRLVAILELPDLFRVAKAIDLITEQERLFHDARIVTDIRTIFSDSRPQQPIAAMIIQQMKVEFHEESGIRSVFLALDGGDIANLREILDRAQEKYDTLKSVVTGMNLPLFELGEEIGPS